MAIEWFNFLVVSLVYLAQFRNTDCHLFFFFHCNIEKFTRHRLMFRICICFIKWLVLSWLPLGAFGWLRLSLELLCFVWLSSHVKVSVNFGLSHANTCCRWEGTSALPSKTCLYRSYLYEEILSWGCGR